jgi:lysophospholipase L1-like esterase
VGEMYIKVNFYVRSLVNLLLGCGVVFILVVVFTAKVGAEPTPEISWLNDFPTVLSSKKTDYFPEGICHHPYTQIEVAGETGLKNGCITRGENVTFGFYYHYNQYRSVIRFSNDSKFYRLYGACSKYDDCIYLPNKDYLITKRFFMNYNAKSFVLYKDFTNRLMPIFNPSTLALEYHLKNENPDYEFKDSNGQQWFIGGFGASENGDWIAIEMRSRGFALFDVENFSMKRISDMGFSYGTGLNPTVEISVNENGKVVAFAGRNAGFYVIEIDEKCGDDISHYNTGNIPPLANKCGFAPMNYSFINNFYVASRPRLTNDGFGIDIYAKSYSGEIRQVSIGASGYQIKKLEYLAMGDSFSSGEGEFSDDYYLPMTNDEFEKCHLSSRSYPFLLASLSELDLDYVRSVACSGAKTIDVAGDANSYRGQNNRLITDGIDLNKNDQDTAKEYAMSFYVPGRVLQSSFVQRNKPDVITIGIGGNDVGVVDKLKACLGPGTCTWASDSKRREQFADEIKSLFETLVNLYQEINSLSVNSKIYAVGYALPTDINNTCDIVTRTLINDDERRLLQEAILYLNDVIEAAAAKAGIGFLDIEESYDDQSLCGEKKPYAVNSFMLGDDIGVGWIKVIGSESFHPNPYGHQLIASYINIKYGDIFNNEYCDGILNICPTDTKAPEPSSYWETSNNDYPKLKLMNFIKGLKVDEYRSEVSIYLPKTSMAKNSELTIQMNSKPVFLGSYIADNEGSFFTTIELPVEVEDGFHTMIISGKSYSDEKIDLYQVFKYESYKQNVEEQQTDTSEKDSFANDTDVNEAITNEEMLELIEQISINDNSESESISRNYIEKDSSTEFNDVDLSFDRLTDYIFPTKNNETTSGAPNQGRDYYLEINDDTISPSETAVESILGANVIENSETEVYSNDNDDLNYDIKNKDNLSIIFPISISILLIVVVILLKFKKIS